ncbi:MAG TPA: hypothetical protein PLD20_11680 [Blastocatellia bacterium]|nr:hypothetical protein [Blastocatellia bacterium]HMX28286.1 hypothetical protein [Blastocatellia bacterium]HMZ18584.1 hypothetical protein [Blastocatellia bacterium]HNG29079.1 hypothetical protein [Blastocatellia bacterium]
MRDLSGLPVRCTNRELLNAWTEKWPGNHHSLYFSVTHFSVRRETICSLDLKRKMCPDISGSPMIDEWRLVRIAESDRRLIRSQFFE